MRHLNVIPVHQKQTLNIRVHSMYIVAKLAIEKGNPDPIHHTQTAQPHKRRTPGYPGLRTATVYM